AYNNMAHLEEHGHKYLIRSKDINSATSILKNYFKGKEGEFDEDISIILTNKHTNFIRENKDKYRTVMSNQTFDYLDLDNHFYEMKFRVVRIRIDGNKEEYESVITNLDRAEFPKEEIKDLYIRRWNIMTSSALCSKCRVLINAENNLNLLI
ncbi:MAG: transposase, partial [Erysipelotrichaceae bacterium]|nr:transposase [Erysipelotrichaceae bacterium]